MQAKNKAQEHELSKKKKTIARFSSKMVALRRIVSQDSEDDDHIDNDRATLPVIVKVESVESKPNLNDGKGFVCRECHRKFRSDYTLKNHMLLHSEPTFPCPICPIKFARQDYVKRHMKNKHKNV